MPDANGHPLPGEPGYDEYAKVQGQAAGQAEAGATRSRMGYTDTNTRQTPDGPVDLNGHPLPGNKNYDEYARVQGQYGAQSSAAADHARDQTQYPDQPPTPPGPLSGPGPYETWASEHAGDFGDPSNTETIYGTYGQGLFKDPSAAEDFYSKYGQDFANPSNSETLYSQGIGQLNPYYDYAQKIGTKAINDAAAAHGGFSSTALTQTQNLAANLRGQQAQQMATLAKQADDERLARYGLGETEATAADKGKNDRYTLGAALGQSADKGKLDRYGAQSSIYGNWQDREEARLTGALTSQMHLSEDQAGQVDKFFTNLLEAGKYDAEGINAALQAAGVDPNSAFARDLVSIGKAYATSYAGGAGKASGQGVGDF